MMLAITATSSLATVYVYVYSGKPSSDGVS
jgi:hypothetical protein